MILASFAPSCAGARNGAGRDGDHSFGHRRRCWRASTDRRRRGRAGARGRHPGEAGPGEGRPAQGRSGRGAEGDVRRWMLLVHGAAVREAAGRPLGHLRVHRGPGEEPDLRAGVEPRDGPCRSGRDRLRPEGDRLRAAARGVLAQRGSRPPTTASSATGAGSIGRASSCTTPSSGGWPRSPNGRSRRRRPSACRSSRSIEDAGPFWVAEDYHQDYYKTNPVRYYSYRTGCGRDRRLAELWGDKAGK